MTRGAAPKTQLHRDLIRAGVRRAQEDNRRSGRPINQWPLDYHRVCDLCDAIHYAKGLCRSHYWKVHRK
jgi:hypothetical protein